MMYLKSSMYFRKDILLSSGVLILLLLLACCLSVEKTFAADPVNQNSTENKDPDVSTASSPDDDQSLSPIKLIKKGTRSFLRAQDFAPMISTDRNSVTPHPNAVPLGYLQIESGSTLSKFHRGGDYITPETVFRLGTWSHGECRFQVPNYVRTISTGDDIAGVTDIQVSIKQEVEPHFLNKRGFDLGVITGLTLPTGSKLLTTKRVDPFVQPVLFYRYRDYTLGTSHGIFFPSEFPDDDVLDLRSERNVTYQPTVILFRHLKTGKKREEKADVWIEYAGLFSDSIRSLQIIDLGGVWRPWKRHQLDLRIGFGVSSAAPRAFIGFGYSWLPGKVLPFYKRAPEHTYRP